MQRHDRTRFVLFGIASLVNIAALLLFALGLATRGRGGSEASVPLILVLAGLLLLVVLGAAIARGCDLGWPAWGTFAGCVLTVTMGPVLLVLAGYLSIARGQPTENNYGAPPPPASAVTWFWALMLAVFPWAVLLVLGRALA